MLIAEQYHLNLSEDELKIYQGLVDGGLGSYRRVAELKEPKLPVKYPRTNGYPPSPDENPLNAWYWRCSIESANGGACGKKLL